MTELPVATTPVPPLIFMLPVSRTPIPVPVPPPSRRSSKSEQTEIPLEAPSFTIPTLRLEVRDLKHAGAQDFLTAVVASDALATAVKSVLRLLYQSPDSPMTTVPPTRSVTLIIRRMPGVAYTTGNDLDSDHKEIHFSLDYIHSNVSHSRKTDEIMGVLTHEMVHCYQYNGFGTCPGGLIEGIADWVRLNAKLSPPHWKKEASGKWDAGYQHTGYFLEYLEHRFGEGLIRRMNEKLRIVRYEEKRFWTELCGRPVEQLWGDYAATVEKGEDKESVLLESEDADPKPTPTSKEQFETAPIDNV